MGGGRQLPDGGFILGGSIVDPNDIVADPGAAGYAGYAGRSNIFVARTDGAGNPLWTQTFGKTDAEGRKVWRSTFGDPDMIDYSVVLAEAAGSGYIAAGEWVKDYYSGDSDMALVKINAQGQLVWQQKIETNAHHMLARILQHPDGDYVIATSIVSNRGFEFDIMLIKIDIEVK